MAKRRKASNGFVIKQDNMLIQDTINTFDMSQNQVIKALIAKCADLKNRTLEDKTVYIPELIQAMEMKKGGSAYAKICRALTILQNTLGPVQYYFINPETNDTEGKMGLSYFQSIYTNFDPKDPATLKKFESKDESYYVTVCWNNQMQKLLTGVSRQFTQIELQYYMQFQSVHTQNLYELLKSYQNYEARYNKRPRFEIEYLRRKLDAGAKYKTAKCFYSNCLHRPIARISEISDIKVEANYHGKCPRPYCEFHIERKKPPINYEGCWFENEDKLNEIIYTHQAKKLIYKLGEIKTKNLEEYDRLKTGGKSDYDIIMMWVRNEQLIEEAKKNGNVIDNEEIVDEKAKLMEHIEKEELPGWYGITEGTVPEPELLKKALELQKKGA